MNGYGMRCEFCGGETTRRYVRKQHWFRRKLYILEDVVAEVCQECGERYYHATTLDAIGQMLSGQPIMREYIQAAVVAMPRLAASG